jgi:hypothetical protein
MADRQKELMNEVGGGAPPYVRGLCIIRGAAVPVADTGVLIGGQATKSVVRETIADPSWEVAIRAVDLNPAVLEKAARALFLPGRFDLPSDGSLSAVAPRAQDRSSSFFAVPHRLWQRHAESHPTWRVGKRGNIFVRHPRLESWRA